MLEKITDDIEKIVVRSIEGMEEVNCYLVEGKHGVTIIDTGDYSERGIAIWERIFGMGIEVEKVVLTHTHQDHIGLAKWFQQTKGIPIIVAKRSYKEMKKYLDPNFNQTFNDLLKKHGFSEGPLPYQADPFIYDFEPDGFFDIGGTIELGDDTYEVVWTPGHAPDQFCFYHKDKKVMFVGDHVINNLSPVVGLWTAKEENLLEDYFQSLELIKKYPVEIGLAGHGENIYDLYHQANEIRKKHHHRLEQLIKLTAGEGKTAEQVCLDIYGSVKLSFFLGPFMATITRLLYLEACGNVKREEKNGVFYFRSV